jgi:hypothetical protein
MRERAVVVRFGPGEPGAAAAGLLAVVGRVLLDFFDVLLVEFLVLVAAALAPFPLLVGVIEDAAVIAEVELAAVALADGL